MKKSCFKKSARAYLLFNVIAMCTKFYVSPCIVTFRSEELLTLGALAQRGLLYLVRKFSVCLSVCYHVLCNHAQRDNERVIPKGSALYRLDFRFGDFRKSNAFNSYGVKTKLTSQYAN